MTRERCTECNRKSRVLHLEFWNARTGYIIKKGEKLCTRCASKRSIKTLSQIEKALALELGGV